MSNRLPKLWRMHSQRLICLFSQIIINENHGYLQPYCPTVCMTENMGAPFSIFINGEILDTTLFLSTVGAVSLLLLASSTFSSDYSSPMRACYSQKQTDCFDTSDSLILIWPNISFPVSSFFPVCRKTLCTETSNWETWCWTNGKRNVFTHHSDGWPITLSGSVILACQ